MLKLEVHKVKSWFQAVKQATIKYNKNFVSWGF